MIENFKEKPGKFRDYDSEFLLKILKKSSIETNKNDDKEFFFDKNWKINLKNKNIIPPDNSNLKRILLEIFPDRKILIQDNNDGSQTICLS